MSFDLSNLERPESGGPIIGTIFGGAGVGKTTLASLFDRPVFIRTEDGTGSLKGHPNVRLLPLCERVSEVKEQIRALIDDQHNFGTLALDSITQFATIVENKLVKSEGKDRNINTAFGGYGAGQTEAAMVHFEIRKMVNDLRAARGMNIIFIGHQEIERVELPDCAAFDQYSLKIHKKSKQSYIDNVDFVAFIKLKTVVSTEKGEKVRVVGTGGREIIAYNTPNNISKNRYGITKPIPFIFDGSNPLAEYLYN